MIGQDSLLHKISKPRDLCLQHRHHDQKARQEDHFAQFVVYGACTLAIMSRVLKIVSGEHTLDFHLQHRMSGTEKDQLPSLHTPTVGNPGQVWDCSKTW